MRGPADEVEALLTRAARAGLPFRRLMRLYLDPFSLFKDASSGPASARARALSYNRAMRWMLLHYIRRWMVIGVSLFLGVAPAQALAAQQALFVIPAAAFAVGACIAIAVTACALVAYVLLGARQST